MVPVSGSCDVGCFSRVQKFPPTVINTKVSVKNCAHLKPKTHARETITGPIITKVSVKNCAHLKPETHARETSIGPIITSTKGANGNGSMYVFMLYLGLSSIYAS